MPSLVIPDKSKPTFEDIKKVVSGVEFWDARDLMALVDYYKWQDFHNAIKKAMMSHSTNGGVVEKHFLLTSVKSGGRPAATYLLTRHACYLIFQAGDTSKPEIAAAQAYFVNQTRRQEVQDQRFLDSRRQNLRDRVETSTEGLTHLATTIHNVTNPDKFHSAGVSAMYNMDQVEAEAFKGIEEGKLLDQIDSAELAAHYFRITQTEQALINDAYTKSYIYDQEGAEELHKSVGVLVRSTMRETGGTLPEDLPSVEDITAVKDRLEAKSQPKKSVDKSSHDQTSLL